MLTVSNLRPTGAQTMNATEHGPLLLYWLFKLGDVPKGDEKWLMRAEHFVADDVMSHAPVDENGDWFYTQGSQDNQIWSPPFPIYWIEYGLDHQTRTGALIVAATPDEMFEAVPSLRNEEGLPLLQLQEDAPDAKWYLIIKLFHAVRDRGGVFEGVVRVPVNGDGRRASSQFRSLLNFDHKFAEESMSESLRDLGFVHNVLNSPRVISAAVPLANKRVSREIVGKSGSKGYRYRIAVVRSNQTRTNQATGLVEHRCLPWHTVRGHWRRYDGKVNPATGKPSLLFGRLAGNYWIASTVRGKLDHGKVVKDYWIEQNNGKNRKELGR
jgi:hypothetical protein